MSHLPSAARNHADFKMTVAMLLFGDVRLAVFRDIRHSPATEAATEFLRS